MRQKDDPWHPMTDGTDLKYLGKLSEEGGELCAAIGRCIIQGIDGSEPDSLKTNRRWLEEEIADVLANIALVSEHFKLNEGFIAGRSAVKKTRLKVWHDQA